MVVGADASAFGLLVGGKPSGSAGFGRVRDDPSPSGRLVDGLAVLGAHHRGLFAQRVGQCCQQSRRWASRQTGIGVEDAFKALKTLDLDPATLAKLEESFNVFEDLTTCKVNSFPGRTQVLMADGSHREIGSLKVGDLVVASDPTTGERRAEPVTAAFRHDTERPSAPDTGHRRRALIVRACHQQVRR
ncbi:Hint domain-containing protein [Streptomyces sp. NBC_01431]|uniref:Hint domain-containing protein n=1 Tax=Streptomyces sp. NBC_01431 TaxID=2903863 RepID=UPI002E30337F|nr:Hint domain-containing protein [Streptomyces sp. NBC_01431]